MKLKMFFQFVVIVVFLLFTELSFAFENGDWQFWFSQALYGKLNNDWGVTFSEELRYGNDISVFYHKHFVLGVSYEVLDNWSFSANFKYLYEKKNGDWKKEKRPYLDFSYKFGLNKIKLKNRIRVEYRDRETKSYYRFRNQLIVFFPKLMDKYATYISEEVFIDTEDKEINRNRLKFGMKRHFFSKFFGEIYYLWQTDKKNSWKDTNIIGLKVKIVF